MLFINEKGQLVTFDNNHQSAPVTGVGINTDYYIKKLRNFFTTGVKIHIDEFVHFTIKGD